MGNKIKNFFLSIGRFFRIVDEQSPFLSITNIACMVIIVKVALATEPSVADLGGLLIALLAYHGKKHVSKRDAKLSAEQTKAIDDLQSKVKEVGDRVGGIAAMVGIKNLKQ